jgi:hypothetical protein
VLATLDEVESRWMIICAGSAAEQREVKRRIAEMKLTALFERDVEYGEMRSLIARLRALGYSNLDREITMEFFFALHCARQGRAGEARSLFAALDLKLSTSGDVANAEYIMHERSNIERELSRLT